MSNTVELKAVGALLTGKEHFYIPSYQRGYRWRKNQVEDLLGDLYSFTKRPRIDRGDVASIYGDYYCLQPLIVKPIPVGDPRRDKALPPDIASDKEHHLWELVDGQQRLTSILLILRTFLGILKQDIEEMYEKKYFTLYYESRPYFLDDIERNDAEENIDLCHARAVCRVADDWTSSRKNGKGIELSKLYVGGNGDNRVTLINSIVNLLTDDKQSDVVKFIWYELDKDSKADTVREFIRINNGKIPLLDSELVKALFLQRRFDRNGKLVDLATQRAMEWENMENRLNASDFWAFISPDGNEVEDRMGYLLEIVYRAERKNSATPDERSNQKIEKGDIFRFFYNDFEGKRDAALQKAIENRWNLIVDAFHAIEDWYESPLRYNYIGFLIQTGTAAADIYTAFRTAIDGRLLNDNKDEITFDQWLKSQIRLRCSNVEIAMVDTETEGDDAKKPRIMVKYGGRGTGILRNLFRLLNIELLTSQFRRISQNADSDALRDSGVFRFPFDIYKANGWDIEHIDSQTENPLKANKDQVRWIAGALLDTNNKLTDTDRKRLHENVEAVEKDRDFHPSWDFLAGKVSDELLTELTKGAWRTAISLIQNDMAVESSDVDFIGNLTLLDAETNRSYKNALFCSKRKDVIEAVGSGQYILPATQYVFLKFFDNDTISATSRIRWTAADKEKYHDFILTQLKDFLPDAQ